MAKEKQKGIYKRERIKGASIRKAAEIAGIDKNTGVNIEKDPVFHSEMRRALDKAGASADKIAETVARNLDAQKVISANIINKSGDGMADAHSMTKDFVEVPDCMAQLKAAELAGKFRSDFVENVKHSGSISIDYASRLEQARKKAIDADRRKAQG